jgi:hypothetical protein
MPKPPAAIRQEPSRCRRSFLQCQHVSQSDRSSDPYWQASFHTCETNSPDSSCSLLSSCSSVPAPSSGVDPRRSRSHCCTVLKSVLTQLWCNPEGVQHRRFSRRRTFVKRWLVAMPFFCEVPSPAKPLAICESCSLVNSAGLQFKSSAAPGFTHTSFSGAIQAASLQNPPGVRKGLYREGCTRRCAIQCHERTLNRREKDHHSNERIRLGPVVPP